MTLRKKHQEFINQLFLCNMNQVEAYLKVYPKSSYNAARAHAARLVANGNIRAEIKLRLDERQMSADEVLMRLGDMGRGNLADFAGVEDARGLVGHPKAHVVKKIEKTVTLLPKGGEITNTKIELNDPMTALLNIGKNHGLFTDRQVLTVKVEKEIDLILDILERVLDADTYERVLSAISGEAGV